MQKVHRNISQRLEIGCPVDSRCEKKQDSIEEHTLSCVMSTHEPFAKIVQ